MRRILLISAMVVTAWLLPLLTQAQTCSPKAVFSYTKDGEEVEEELTEFTGQAPVTGRFTANPENYDGYEPSYEWRVYSSDKTWETYDVLTRTGETLEYTFTQSGTFYVELRVTFNKTENGTITETVIYPDEGNDAVRFAVTVAESKLEMPNAFSPNGDGINDIYRAKPEYKNIVSFRAIILNRWGQKLYEWNDPAGGWDGKFHGRDVNQGVYFVLVEAKGADGKDYKIKKDVNLLRGYTENGESTQAP